MALFATLLRRNLRLAARRRTDALLPLVFFAVAISLFPLAVGPEPQQLRQIAPGVVWVCALLATMMSVQQLYAGDHADGSLAQLMLAPAHPLVLVAAHASAHWLTLGAPLVLAAPLAGLLFGLPPPTLAALMASLLLGTPVLSLLGGLGAALTLGLRSGGLLLLLIVPPLALPVLIFGAGAVVAVDAGDSAAGHFSLLGALLLASLLGVPWATSAALRISTD